PLTNAQLTVKATGNGRNWSAWADNWQQFMQQGRTSVIAAQAAADSTSGGVSGWIDKTLGDIGHDVGSAVGTAVGDVAKAVGWPADVVGFFSDADHALGTASHVALALFQPSTYVRLVAGGLALTFLIIGLFAI